MPRRATGTGRFCRRRPLGPAFSQPESPNSGPDPFLDALRQGQFEAILFLTILVITSEKERGDASHGRRFARATAHCLPACPDALILEGEHDLMRRGVCNKCGERRELVLAGCVCDNCRQALDAEWEAAAASDWVLTGVAGDYVRTYVYRGTTYIQMRRRWATWNSFHSFAHCVQVRAITPQGVREMESRWGRWFAPGLGTRCIRPATPQETKNSEAQAQQSRDRVKKNIAWGAALIFALFVVNEVGDEWMRVPDGSHCVVSQSVYGVRDLGKAYDELTKAQKVNDDLGIAELVQKEVAIPVAVGTHVLVIESDFLKRLTFYRDVRILDGPYTGKAVWVNRDALQTRPAPQTSVAQPPSAQPLLPETCRDPHERLGSTGVCFCEPGYTSDPDTLKCVPKR